MDLRPIIIKREQLLELLKDFKGVNRKSSSSHAVLICLIGRKKIYIYIQNLKTSSDKHCQDNTMKVIFLNITLVCLQHLNKASCHFKAMKLTFTFQTNESTVGCHAYARG